MIPAMSTITEEEVRHVAGLARLKLSGKEVKKLSKELSAILMYIGILSELDTDNIEPTAQVAGLTNIFREDEVRPCETTTNEMLECSPLPIVNNQIETLSAHE